MRCPRCGHVNAADADRCARCQFDLRYLQEKVYGGCQFVFLDASEEEPIAVTLDGAEPQVFTAPTIISRHRHAIAFGEEERRRELCFPRLEMPALDLVTVITDRRIYRPQDEVTICVIGLNTPEGEAELEIKLAGQLVYEEKLTLNEAGLALHRFGDLEEGEYEVEVKVLGRPTATASCTFSVAEFTLSPLTAVLEAHRLEKELLHFRLKLMQLSVPYEGEVELGLACGFCRGQVVATKKAKIRAGVVEGEFYLSGHTGPFTVQLITPGGETASVAFPSTRREERERITINPLGRTVEAGLLPFAGARELRGLHYDYTGAASTPFILEAVEASVGRVRAATDASLAQLVVFDPLSQESRVMEFRHVKKGDSLEFEVDAPYSLFTLGAFTTRGPYEAWGVVIRPVELRATLHAPEKAAPGEEITVRLMSPHPCFCLLLVYDARLEHESPIPKLAKRIFEQLRYGTRELHEGQPDSLKERGKKLRRFDMEAREFAVSTVLAMRAAPVELSALMAKGVPTAAAPTLLVEERRVVEFVVAPTREAFIELAHIELFPIKAVAEHRITLGDQIGTWRCRAYLFAGCDYIELTKDVEATKEPYAELDLPAIVGEGDEVYASVRFHTAQPAILTINTPTEQIKRAVSGDGVEEFALRAPGELMVNITSPAGTDWSVREVAAPGVQMVTASRLEILARGETAFGKRVVVYPSMGHLLSETIEALVRYPFGCAEQTSSILYGLAVAYRGIGAGLVPGNLARVKGLVMAGVNRLQGFQHEDGMFSLWRGGKPDKDTTVKVTHRLLGLRGLPFPAVEEMLERSRKALLRHKVRDNQLLPLDAAFRDRLRTVEDAVALYFHGDGWRDEALSHLRRTVKREDGRVHWEATRAWGGTLEVTCDAARVMYHAGDELFHPAFDYVAGKLVDGRLYSTADTRALVELLAAIRADGDAMARIDGREVRLSDITIGQEVTALSDNLVVRVDEEIVLDYLEPRTDFRFQVRPSKTRLTLGERLRIHIQPQEESLCPLARIYLPGCLALVRAGANAQTSHLPVKTGELVVEAVAVRQGEGQLHVALHDMYDAEKVGTVPGIRISVMRRSP